MTQHTKRKAYNVWHRRLGRGWSKSQYFIRHHSWMSPSYNILINFQELYGWWDKILIFRSRLHWSSLNAEHISPATEQPPFSPITWVISVEIRMTNGLKFSLYHISFGPPPKPYLKCSKLKPLQLILFLIPNFAHYNISEFQNKFKFY